MANGEVLQGQLLYGPLQQVITYTQQSCDLATAAAAIGDPMTEVTPTDKVNSEVKIYSPPNLSSFFQKYTTPGNIQLPNVLETLDVVYSEGGSDADYTENASADATGSAWSVGVSVSGTAQASSFSVPKLIHTISTPPQENVPIINCFFFSTALDAATILARLSAELGSTVIAWPIFKPKPLTFILTGTRVSASARRDYQGSASAGSGGTITQSDGIGSQYDYSPSVETVEIPPTLHTSFNMVAGSFETHTGTTTVTVTAGIISGGGTSTVTATAVGGIAPNAVVATSPGSIPTTGLYLYRYDPGESTTFGNFIVHAQVFDFSTIA